MTVPCSCDIERFNIFEDSWSYTLYLRFSCTSKHIVVNTCYTSWGTGVRIEHQKVTFRSLKAIAIRTFYRPCNSVSIFHRSQEIQTVKVTIWVLTTRAQQLLVWTTVPEQSGPRSGGECCAPFHVRASWVPSSHGYNTSVPSGILINPTTWP